jgi:hypothetical protein
MRHRNRTPFVFALAGLLLIGCGGPEVRGASFLTAPLPAKSADAPIAIFQVQVPGCSFEEIGTVVARGEFGSERLISAMRTRARGMGGDAIIGYSYREPTIGAIVHPGPVPHAIPVKVPEVTGTVIRFTGSDCTQ